MTEQAKTDLETAYNAASAQSPDSVGGVELAGLTLEPGVYSTGGVIELNGNLTLDGNGDPNAVFVFQSLSTLLAGSGSSITFIDGATACNLYWRVPSSATIQAGSQFAGTILAAMTITFGAGATLDGRALAQDGEVTMINNTITRPECAAMTLAVSVRRHAQRHRRRHRSASNCTRTGTRHGRCGGSAASTRSRWYLRVAWPPVMGAASTCSGSATAVTLYLCGGTQGSAKPGTPCCRASSSELVRWLRREDGDPRAARWP